MYYFIPSWYSDKFKWQTEPERWYFQRKNYEFDDTVNQVRMFMDAGEEVTLLSLSYFPWLRHFLHSENIYPLSICSVFDAMQQVKIDRIGLFSYRDLPWPDNVHFVYTPFVTLAYEGEHKYARLEFGEDGNLMWIDYFQGQEFPVCTELYDDRGFLSSVRFYKDQRPFRQDFFNTDHDLMFRWNLLDQSVSIEPVMYEFVSYKKYDTMEALLYEVMEQLLQTSALEDTFIIASNEAHNPLLLKATEGKKIVLSYFEDRYDLGKTAEIQRDVVNARFLVADTEHIAKKLKDVCRPDIQVYDISPFDTRLSLGKSQRTRTLKVFMPVDGLDDPYRSRALKQIFLYMQKNKNVHLLLATADGSDARREELKKYMTDLLFSMNITAFTVGEKQGIDSENEMFVEEKKEKKTEARIFITPYFSENDLIHILDDVRLILDVTDQPNLYLQIAGISAGIPQVNYRFTRYIEHQKDGYIIQNIDHITEALEYYLSGLKHWNEALVYCVRQISYYTGGNIVKRWKELDKQGEEMKLENHTSSDHYGSI